MRGLSACGEEEEEEEEEGKERKGRKEGREGGGRGGGAAPPPDSVGGLPFPWERGRPVGEAGAGAAGAGAFPSRSLTIRFPLAPALPTGTARSGPPSLPAGGRGGLRA